MFTVQTALHIIQSIISVALIAVIVFQAKSSGLGAVFGGEGGGITRTRRGLEKTLFQITIGLSVAFFIVAIVTVIFFQTD